MKIVVDGWGEPLKPWDTVMSRNGSYWTVIDLTPEGPDFQVGAVFEGGCPEEDGDYFKADFFFCKVIEKRAEPDVNDWRQEALDLWVS